MNPEGLKGKSQKRGALTKPAGGKRWEIQKFYQKKNRLQKERVNSKKKEKTVSSEHT